MLTLVAAVALCSATPSAAPDLHLSLAYGDGSWAHPPEDRWVVETAPEPQQEDAPDPGAPAPRWRTREVLAGGALVLAGWAPSAALVAWSSHQLGQPGARPGDVALAASAAVAAAVLLPPWFATIGVSLAADEPGNPGRAYLAALAVHAGASLLVGYSAMAVAMLPGPVLAGVVVVAAFATELWVMPAMASWRFHPSADERVPDPAAPAPWDVRAGEGTRPAVALSF